MYRMSSANWSRRPEPVQHRRRGQVRDMADHPGHAHAAVGGAARPVVAAALPGRVAHDRLTRDRVPGDALRVEGVRGGDRHDGVDLIGKQDRPARRPASRRATRPPPPPAARCRVRPGTPARSAPCPPR